MEEQTQTQPNRLTSRRFALAAALVVSGIVALFTGHLSGENYVELAAVTLVGYGATRTKWGK